jgi:hypothetical protein
VEATGAVPFFGEAREIDGFAAATLAMPAILGAAAVRATIASPTARDLDRAGAGPLASLTAVVDADVPSPEEIVALRSHIVRLLETLADELSDVAGRLASSDPDHDPAAITNAAERRRSWLLARATPADAPPIEHMPKPERRRLFF